MTTWTYRSAIETETTINRNIARFKATFTDGTTAEFTVSAANGPGENGQRTAMRAAVELSDRLAKHGYDGVHIPLAGARVTVKILGESMKQNLENAKTRAEALRRVTGSVEATFTDGPIEATATPSGTTVKAYGIKVNIDE